MKKVHKCSKTDRLLGLLHDISGQEGLRQHSQARPQTANRRDTGGSCQHTKQSRREQPKKASPPALVVSDKYMFHHKASSMI